MPCIKELGSAKMNATRQDSDISSVSDIRAREPKGSEEQTEPIEQQRLLVASLFACLWFRNGTITA